MVFDLLILEDNPLHIQEIMTSLKRLFPRVNFRIAIDGCQYLLMLQSSTELPDLAILDVRVSELDGFEVLAEIRKHEYFNYLPIVMFSASESSINRVRSLSLGATDYIVKPPLKQMGEKLKEICNRYIDFDTQKPDINLMPQLFGTNSPCGIGSEIDQILERL